MQRLMWGLALAALGMLGLPSFSRGAGYLYLETFDNDADAFTPPANYGSAQTPATGSPPADWTDGRNAPSLSSNAIVEEVPSGHNSVAAGPSGGANMGLVFGPGSWNPTNHPLSPQPLGTVSMQVDFLSDVALRNSGGFLITTFASSAPADRSSLSQVHTGVAMFQDADPSTGQPRNTLSRYREDGASASPFFTLPAARGWYTLETLYEASSTLDPTSGLPLLAETINVYEQAPFGNGFRQATRVFSLENDLNALAYPFIVPNSIGVATGSFPRQFQYIDNVAIGPLINTPEPCVVALAGIAAVMVPTRRTRRR